MTKIACLMWYDDGIKSYGDINYTINKIYCDKYGYDLIKSDKKRYTDDYHPAWERLPLIIENLEKYDYIIWIDADAHFYRDAPPITNIINEHKDQLFIFSKDYDHKYNNENSSINSGFFIVKNSSISLEFLNTWAYDKKLYEINPQPYFWEQGVLVYMYGKNIGNIRDISIRLNFGILQHFKKTEYNTKPYPYIYHAAGTHKNYRVTISKHNLEFNKTDDEYFTQIKLNKLTLPITSSSGLKSMINSSRVRTGNRRSHIKSLFF